MASEDSLKQSMDIAVQHYSSLFRLPSHRKVLLLLALFCVGGGLISVAVLFPSLYGLFGGLCLGSALFALSLIADYCTSRFVLKKDTIFDLRRTVAVSLFCWGTWFFFILLGSLVALGFGFSWWVRLCFLGFSAAMILRLLVFRSTASLSYIRLLVSSFLQPFLCIAPFVVFFWDQTVYQYAPSVYGVLVFLIAALIISVLAPFTFLFLLNKLGEKALGIGTLPLFRAFMLNWVLNLNAPFEELLEKLGEQRDIKISLLEFVTAKGKSVFVVPSVHPGPFKNIGSSVLPSLLKSELEREFGSVVSVPHGLLGHEFDLASQAENRKVVANVAGALRDSEVFEVKASPFVTVSNGLATACCQVFGGSAFISFTLAPRTIEDLPDELGFFVRQEAKKRGLDLCAVVNAHNSIDGNAEMPEFLDSLKDVGAKCFEKAVSMERLPFSVGAATVLPREFSLEDGMGHGGITAVVVASGAQKAVYVVIDGNNMISGLREKVLSSLRSMGFDDGEVFTTDTHAVSALVLGSRGYRAIGEALDNELLLSYIKTAAAKAEASMDRGQFSCREITVSNVRVIGGEHLESLCVLIEKALHRAKVSVVPVFAISGLLLMLLLLLV
jgi:putative membrane protein